MKTALRWLVGAAVLAALGLALLKFLPSKPGPASAPASPKAAPVLELGAAEVLSTEVATLVRSVEVSGSIKAVRSAFVKARVAGDVVKLPVREGEAVKAGQVVAEQDTAELDLRLRQAEQQATSARAQLEIAQRTLANNRALVAQGFISATALEASISNESGAQASLQAALAAADLARKARADAQLTAPLSGFVAQRLVQPGERVAVDARLLEIVDLTELEVEVAVAPEDAVALQVGRPAQLRVEGLPQILAGRVARLNPTAQAGSRSVMAYLSLKPHPALRQGLFASGTVTLEERQALSLPATALRMEGSTPFVLALEGDTVVKRKVRTGLRGRTGRVERVEILEGLSVGARVLSSTLGPVAEGSRWRMAAPGGAPSDRAAAASAPAAAPSAAVSR